MYTNRHRAIGAALCIVILASFTACKKAETPAPSKPASPFTAEADTAAKTISADYLRDQITHISSDEFQGRGPGTPGDRAARAYLIEQLKGLGLQPGGGADQWEQPVELIGTKPDMPKQWTFKHGAKTLSLKWWDQYMAGSGIETDRGEIKNAEIVFVGYGIQAPEYGWDDFKGQDLKGKVLLMLNNDPDWDPALFAGTTRLYYGRWVYKYESAARQGAAGAIIIHTTPSAGYPWQVVQTSWSGEKFELPNSTAPRVQAATWVTEDSARQLAKLAGQDLDKLVESAKSKDFKPVSLGVTTSLAFKNTVHHTTTANVFGIIPGSDPQFRDEYVIYTAHHDHLGVGEPDTKGDRIYNGAMDNAAGDAQLLAIAKAIKALPTPPKRSTMVLFVAAEEQGLLGSQYFAEHPTMPAGKIATNINYDGGNIWGRTRDITYVGKGKSTLDAIVDEVAGRQGRTVKPDQFPDRGHFYRSDQFNFAKIGVPALYLDTGTDFIDKPAEWGKQQVEYYEAHHYHQPSDEIQADWNYDGMIDDAQLGFWVGYIVGNAATPPAWNAGDEFEAARKKAIAASP
jgi:Zn-dependent M28 family amino/carboxypeptidase